jgi:poly [ADP-ribose] polymerase 6/8
MKGNEIKISLPRDFLPLSMQTLYGFLVSDTLVDISIVLKFGSWTQWPTTLSVVHPVYGLRFIGYPLVQTALEKFFDPSFAPRGEYKAASYLIPSGNQTINPADIAKMNSQGLSGARAVQALALFGRNVDAAITFLKTGQGFVPPVIIEVSYERCPLLYMVLEMAEVFLSLTDHCCTCGASIRPGLKPSICGAELCKFQVNGIGIGTSVYQEMKRDPLVADLLISLYAASLDFDDSIPRGLGLEEHPRVILQRLPSVRSMVAAAVDDVQVEAMIGEGGFRLIRWLLLSNGSHLITVPESLRLREFPGVAQFMTLLATPYAEAKFDELKRQYGSFFLWHGSSGSRWHAILRQGLKNASRTPLQANGAMLGSGIYMARNSETSWGYSHPGRNHYVGSELGVNIQAISLCEVAPVPTLHDYGEAHVLEDEQAVIVRFLFVNSPVRLGEEPVPQVVAQPSGKKGGRRAKKSKQVPVPALGTQSISFDIRWDEPVWNHDVLDEPPSHVPTLWDLLDFYATRKE